MRRNGQVIRSKPPIDASSIWSASLIRKYSELEEQVKSATALTLLEVAAHEKIGTNGGLKSLFNTCAVLIAKRITIGDLKRGMLRDLPVGVRESLYCAFRKYHLLKEAALWVQFCDLDLRRLDEENPFAKDTTHPTFKATMTISPLFVDILNSQLAPFRVEYRAVGGVGIPSCYAMNNLTVLDLIHSGYDQVEIRKSLENAAYRSLRKLQALKIVINAEFDHKIFRLSSQIPSLKLIVIGTIGSSVKIRDDARIHIEKKFGWTQSRISHGRVKDTASVVYEILSDTLPTLEIMSSYSRDMMDVKMTCMYWTKQV